MSQFSLTPYRVFGDALQTHFAEKVKPSKNSFYSSEVVKKVDYTGNQGDTYLLKEYTDFNQYAFNTREDEQIPSFIPQTGYELNVRLVKYSATLPVSYDMIKNGKYPQQLKDATNDFVDAVNRKLDLNLSLRFSYADATSYTDANYGAVPTVTGDGLAWASASHTLAGSTTTYSNIVSTAPQFSESALILAVETAVRNTYDNKGQIVSFNPSHIVTTNDESTVRAVKKLLTSSAGVSDPNAGVTNTFQNSMQHLVLERGDINTTGGKDTTKSKRWAVVDSRLSTLTCVSFRNPTLFDPSMQNGGFDPRTWSMTWSVDAAYGIEALVGRGWVFSLAV